MSLQLLLIKLEPPNKILEGIHDLSFTNRINRGQIDQVVKLMGIGKSDEEIKKGNVVKSALMEKLNNEFKRRVQENLLQGFDETDNVFVELHKCESLKFIDSTSFSIDFY